MGSRGPKHSGQNPKRRRKLVKRSKMTSGEYATQRREYARKKLMRKIASAKKSGNKSKARKLERQLQVS